MAVLRVFVIAVLLPPVLAVNKKNFKTCEQARFCKNHRHVKPEKAYTLSSPLTVDGSRCVMVWPLKYYDSKNVFDRVVGGISNGEADELKLEISFIASNEVARVRIVEGPHLKPRWENSDVLIPFDLCKEPAIETTSTTSTVRILDMTTHSYEYLQLCVVPVNANNDHILTSTCGCWCRHEVCAFVPF